MPDRPLVKVCGLTDPAEAAACVAAGAWAIGLVFAPESPRVVDLERARAVSAALPPGVPRVGVFVDAGLDELAAAVEACGLSHVQLHGRVDVAAARAATGCEIIEAFAVDGPGALDAARASEAELVLLDASVPGRHGGTGTTFDWSLLEVGDLERPYMLAGGLTPANVSEAVRRLRPAFVDVSSGVERAPGRKDPQRVHAFIRAARSVVEAGRA